MEIMIGIIASLIFPMCIEINTGDIQDYLVREYTIERIDSRENLIYAKGADLGVHGKYKNRTDCSGIYAGLGMDLGLRDENLGKHLNSFKFFELGERYQDINHMRRGDIIFFESSQTYHIATVTTPYKDGKVEILDWVNTKSSRSPSKRYINIVYYGGYWHYNISPEKRFRLMFATNMFAEEFKKQNKNFTGLNNYINERERETNNRVGEYIDYMLYYNIINPIPKQQYILQ